MGVAAYLNEWGYVTLHAHHCMRTRVCGVTSLIYANPINATDEAVACDRRCHVASGCLVEKVIPRKLAFILTYLRFSPVSKL